VDAATKIRTARVTERLTQAELASRSGTTQSAIAAYESGSRQPSDATLRRLLSASGFRPAHLLASRRDEIFGVAERHRAHDVRVFGSISRGEDGPTSDVDLLVRFERGSSLLDLAALEDELTALLGVNVDVVSEGGLRLPKHQAILDDARPL
jgi:uncharacterized protein